MEVDEGAVDSAAPDAVEVAVDSAVPDVEEVSQY